MATVEEARQDENRQTLKAIVDNAPTSVDTSAPVQEILKCYDYDADSSEIFNALCKFYKADLMVAADYLRKLPKTFRYKEDLVRAIINRIDNLLLEECRKCKSWYSVGRQEDPTIACSICGQGGHESCYKNLGPLLEEFPGIQYKCVRCEAVEAPSKVPTKSEKATITNSKGAAIINPQLSSTSIHSSHHQFDDDQEEEEVDEEDMVPICHLLRRGVCPNGISGRTPVNGQICMLRHPKRCQAYCGYGTDQREGCNKGRDCSLLHPILCRNSQRSKMCTNRNCKFTHLKGTRRYKPRNTYNEYDGYTYAEPNYHQENQNHQNEYQAGSSYQNPQRNPPNSNQVEASFLVQLTNQMKDMQKEMREMKEMYKPPSY